MKLFENGVGRPSNEIKKKRKIFIASAIILCIALVSVFAFALTRVSTEGLKGASGSSKLNKTDVTFGFSITSAWWRPNLDSDTKKFNFHINSKASATKHFAVVSCATQSACENVNAWDNAGYGNTFKKRNFGNGTNHTIKRYDRSDNARKALAGTVFYIRVTSYDSSDNWLLARVYKVIVGTTKRKCNVGDCYDVSVSSTGYIKYNEARVETTTKSNPNTKSETCDFKFHCDAEEIDTYEMIKCYAAPGVLIALSDANSLNGVSEFFITRSDDNVKNVSYNNNLFSNNSKKSVEITVTASNTNCKAQTKTITVNKSKAPTSSGASNSGSSSSSNTASKEEEKADKKMKISCESSVKVGEAATCKVTSDGKKLKGATISLESKSVGTVKRNGTKYTVTFKDKLFTTYKSKIKNDSNGKQYIKAKVTVKKNGYTKATDTIKVYKKAPTTTAKKETSSLEKYNITTVINKVTKKNNNEKQLEINVKDLGKNVKYVRYKVCLDRAVCVNDTAANNTYLTDYIGVKKGQTNKVNITTLSSALLNQEFYVRIMTYDKNKKLLYWKVNHFYTDPKTDAKSKNKNVSDESKVKVGDYTGTTSDFLVSLKSDKVKSKYQANFRVPSVKKLSDATLDKGIEKQYNVVMQDFGENVKYVTFALCNNLSDCAGPNTLDIISNDSSKGAILKYQIPEFGKEFIIKTTGDFQILNQKFYVRIYSYDANKVLMFSKYHEFTTEKKSKLGVTKDNKMTIGDRVKADITDKGISQKY